MKKYRTKITRVDIDTGEDITESKDIYNYYKVAQAVKYENISSNEVNKILIIKYKHNGQTEIKF